MLLAELTKKKKKRRKCVSKVPFILCPSSADLTKWKVAAALRTKHKAKQLHSWHKCLVAWMLCFYLISHFQLLKQIFSSKNIGGFVKIIPKRENLSSLLPLSCFKEKCFLFASCFWILQLPMPKEHFQFINEVGVGGHWRLFWIIGQTVRSMKDRERGSRRRRKGVTG